MKLLSSILKPSARQKRAGWTLPEMMVSVGAGAIILISVCGSYVFMCRNLDAEANYEELDRASREAIDVMSRDIRQTGAMTNYSTNSISFTNTDGTLLRYTWDGSNCLTYTNASSANNGPFGGTLLSNCTYLAFSIYQRNPSNGTTMDFFPAGSASLAKVVLINWTCTKTNYVTLKNTESVQTAKVVMRN